METGGEERFESENCEDSDSGQNIDEQFMPSTSQRNQVGRKSLSGQTCSLKTLIDDHVVEAGNSVLSMEFNGTKFGADLLANGSIRWSETKQIFLTPSAWFNHCKRLVNLSESSAKPASAWSTIRYKGKRLDSYKLRWYRKQKKIVTSANMYETAMAYSKTASETINSSSLPSIPHAHKESVVPVTFYPEDYPVREKNVVEHQNLGSRLNDHDPNTMVRCIPFSTLDRIQPFTISISTNALLIIDFHCHLTTGEVVGYLGGTWDDSSHNLSILHAFPCKSRLGDKERSSLVEEEIKQNLEQRNLTAVGWYHSHPFAAPQPTLRDIDSQLEYQIIMRGDSDISYIPCVGLICSPYEEENPRPTSRYQAYWVMPPSEYKPNEYGRPMQMVYSITRDSFLTQDLLLDMRLLAHFYTDAPDSIKFTETFRDGISNWEKLQYSLQQNLPRDLTSSPHQTSAQIQVQQQALSHFWAFLKSLILT